MSKKKELATENQKPVDALVESVAAPSSKLSDEDKHVLELSKMKRALALSNAEKALAQNESAEAQYRYIILQLSVKYNLKNDDIINDDGSIVRK